MQLKAVVLPQPGCSRHKASAAVIPESVRLNENRLVCFMVLFVFEVLREKLPNQGWKLAADSKGSPRKKQCIRFSESTPATSPAGTSPADVAGGRKGVIFPYPGITCTPHTPW